MTRPPEAQIIYDARIRLELSFREAAKRATERFSGITEGSWRRTESERELTRTKETLALMGATVGVTPEQFRRAGRADAADELEQLLAREAQEQELDRPVSQREAQELASQLRAAADRLDPPRYNGHKGEASAGRA